MTVLRIATCAFLCLVSGFFAANVPAAAIPTSLWTFVLCIDSLCDAIKEAKK